MCYLSEKMEKVQPHQISKNSLNTSIIVHINVYLTVKMIHC